MKTTCQNFWRRTHFDASALIRQNDYDLSINKYKEIEREKVEYEPVKDILVRLEENEGEFLKGYRDLCKMLEMDEDMEKNLEKEEMV